MYKIAYIYGLGMIGGSIAISLKKRNISKNIYAYDKNKKSLTFAKKHQIIDDYDTNSFKLLKQADLIIVCAPINSYKRIFEIIKIHKKPECIITDVGSTKTSVINCANNIFGKDQKCFVGSHPLAGKETSGVKNACPNLFMNAVTIITTTNSTNKASLNKIKSFWKKIGCKIETLTPPMHDIIMSETSHVPHLISYSLVNSIYKSKHVKNIDKFTGGGFKDFARIARSNPLMWRDICENNRKNILSSLRLFIKELKLLKLKINQNNYKELHSFFEKTKNKLS